MGAISNFVASKKGKATALGGLTAVGGATLDGYTTYIQDRYEHPEHSEAFSMMKGAAVGAAWLFAEPIMWGITIGRLAGAGVSAMYKDAKEQEQLAREIRLQGRRDATGSRHGTLGGNFIDTQQAYTLRQRQLELLRQHRISTEAALGSEARQLHR